MLQSVAEQMMEAAQVMAGGKSFPVKRTSSKRLKTVRFEVNGRAYQAIEQNPDKPSRWGQLARAGHRVVQFRDIETGKYVAVAVDDDVREYAKRRS